MGAPETEKTAIQNSIAERLFAQRTVMFCSEVTPKTAGALIEQLLAMDAADAKAPITLILNSPGGEVNSGFAVYDTIRFIRPRVRIVCSGLTASIAAVILLAVPAKDRLAMPNSRLLLHQPLYSGEVIGPASDLEITAAEIMKSRSHINAIIAEATGRAIEQVSEDTQRDFWLTATEAVQYGMVSKVITKMSELD